MTGDDLLRPSHRRDLATGDVVAAGVFVHASPVTGAEQRAAARYIADHPRLRQAYTRQGSQVARRRFVADVGASLRRRERRGGDDLVAAAARRPPRPAKPKPKRRKAKLPVDETTGPPDGPEAASKPFPAAWFAEPTEDELPSSSDGVHVEGGRVYGWVARAGDFADMDLTHFLRRERELDDGSSVRVGVFTMNVADCETGACQLDDTRSVAGLVTVGVNERGMWFSGAAAPWLRTFDASAHKPKFQTRRTPDGRVSLRAVNTEGDRVSRQASTDFDLAASAARPKPAPGVALNVGAVRRARAKASSRGQAAPVRVSRRMPRGATVLSGPNGQDRWLHIAPGLSTLFAGYEQMLTDFIADGPFDTVTASVGRLDRRTAGETVLDRDADGSVHVGVTIAGDLGGSQVYSAVKHELGHVADFAVNAADLEACAGHDHERGELVARAFESRLQPHTTGPQAMQAARQVLADAARTVRPRFELR